MLFRSENTVYEERLKREKGKMVDEMNEMTDIIERLKAEVEKLRSQQTSRQHDSQSWFGGLGNGSPKKSIENVVHAESPKKNQGDVKLGADFVEVSTVPSLLQQTIVAHAMDGTFVRFDHSGSSSMVATASSDSTVKVWDIITGQLRGTFRGTPGYAITCCDLVGTLVVGGGSDRSCRVWDRRNERMVSCGSQICPYDVIHLCF